MAKAKTPSTTSAGTTKVVAKKKLTSKAKTLTNPGKRYQTGPLMAGRQTQPSNVNPFGLNGWAFLPKRQYQGLDVTKLDIRHMSSDQLMPMLADISPDFSKSVWDFLRVMGTDIEFEALTLAGEENPSAQGVLDDLIAGVNNQWGGIDQTIRQLGLTSYIQGACSIDAAPTLDLKDLDDLYPVNPDSVYFQRDGNQKLVSFQRQIILRNTGGAGADVTAPVNVVTGAANVATGALPFVMMNPVNFFYVPVDPFVDDPYGRSPVSPAINAVLSLARVLSDLMVVVHHQGWPRIDIKLIWELLEQSIPDSIKEDEDAVGKFVRSRMDEIIAGYADLNPDDAFIHLDYVEINGDNAAAGSKLFDVAAVVHLLRSQLIVALKSLPIFHGEHEGSTETYGTVEYEIYVSSVQVLRELVGDVLARGLEVGLQLRGIPAIVQQNWGPIRTTDRFKDAGAEQLEIENEVQKRDQGWTTQDDASNDITGSDAVGPAPEPMQQQIGGPTAPGAPPLDKNGKPVGQPATGPTGAPQPKEPSKKGGALPTKELSNRLAFAGAGMGAAITQSALTLNGKRR